LSIENAPESLRIVDIDGRFIAMLPRLRRFARGLAGSAHAADDLVQEACERALRAQSSWREGTRFDSWMYRILHNLWIDERRRSRPQAPELEIAQAIGEDGRRVAEARLALDEVRRAIAALPDAQRDVLLLVCVEDVSYREAAEILDVPIGTVMSRLARARMALATGLESKPPASVEEAVR
jgi:RNA polymerase sigma-70 factor (ECF subfamily)